MSEKILGVLGGMGPAASAEFLKILAEKYPARKDQDHPVIYMISDPKIPDRGSAIAGEGEDPPDDSTKATRLPFRNTPSCLPRKTRLGVSRLHTMRVVVRGATHWRMKKS